MQKLSKDTLTSFRLDIASILSHKRLQSYQGDLECYYTNRILAFKARHKIAEIEIYLRNMLDFCLSKLIGEQWIKSERSLALIKPKTHIPLLDLSPHQILSSLMLGEIVGLIGEYEIRHYMFDLQKMDFRKYHWRNRNFCFINGKKHHFSNVAKVNIALNLLRNIRNRAFHWENLLKTREIDNIPYPRITHKENGSSIGIMPEMILVFLDDLIDNINNEVMKRYRDMKIEGF